jgi:hypothetical protein
MIKPTHAAYSYIARQSRRAYQQTTRSHRSVVSLSERGEPESRLRYLISSELFMPTRRDDPDLNRNRQFRKSLLPAMHYAWAPPYV